MKATKAPLAVWNGLLIGSALAVALVLLVHVTIPVPTIEAQVRKHTAAVRAILKETEAKKLEYAKARSVVSGYAWKGDDERVEAQVLELVSILAKKVDVKMGAFRTQKRASEGELGLRPFVLTLEGPYPKVLQFVKKLETPANKLAVNLVQFGASDGASDTVSATVGIYAYQESPTEAAGKPAPGKSASTGKTR